MTSDSISSSRNLNPPTTSYEKGKRFEQSVATLFRRLGFDVTEDYKNHGMQFDLRITQVVTPLTLYALVECKDLARNVHQAELTEFSSKLSATKLAENIPYRGLFVAKVGFAANLYDLADSLDITLVTYRDLVNDLVDLRAAADHAVSCHEQTDAHGPYLELSSTSTNLDGPEANTRIDLRSRIAQWLRAEDPIFVIFGDTGAGKTTFCRRLSWEIVQGTMRSATQRVPILISLQTVTTHPFTMRSMITDHFHQLSRNTFDFDVFCGLNEDGQLILVLDGFDELPSNSSDAQARYNLGEILNVGVGKAKILLTCRTHFFRSKSEEDAVLSRKSPLATSAAASELFSKLASTQNVQVAYLQGLTRKQIQIFLTHNEEHVELLHRAPDFPHYCYELGTSPLLLSMIRATQSTLSALGHQPNRTDLYEVYCGTLLKDTSGRALLTLDQRILLTQALARHLWEEPEHRLHHRAFQTYVEALLIERDFNYPDLEQVFAEVRRDLLFRRDDQGRFSFLHPSFLEFWVARSLHEGVRSHQPSCLDIRPITAEIARYLFLWGGFSDITNFVREVLSGRFQSRVSENALRLLYFQALHLVMDWSEDAGEKFPATRVGEVQEAFAKLRPRNLGLANADLSSSKLRAIDLSGADLSGANLLACDLRDSKFVEARAAGANFSASNLERSVIRGADLRGANLQNANCKGVDFSGANIDGARLWMSRGTSHLATWKRPFPRPGRVRALVVGIDRYPMFPARNQLGTCVGDALLFSECLRGTYGIPGEQIELLLNERATRRGILVAMDALLQRSAEGSDIIFFFSGHGSEARDPDSEISGIEWMPTIVPHDSGRGKFPYRDIHAKTFVSWLERVQSRSIGVTLVFDSAHSGGFIRKVDEEEALRDFFSAACVIMAGCREGEACKEYIVPGAAGHLKHGVFSFMLVSALHRAGADATYKDLLRPLRSVNELFESQHPQIDGACGRRIFGV